MKTIGLLGGMSWESTREYYNILNKLAHTQFGRSNSCPCLIHSFNFKIIDDLQHQGKWQELAELLIDAVKNLELSGAQILMICTNTMHIVADKIESEINIPLIHIVDAVASDIISRGIKTVGLLGTRFTMEKDFFSGRLKEKHDISCLIPSQEERNLIHKVIYNELIQGLILPESKLQYLEIIENLKAKGAEGIILGCTEIPLLIKQEDPSLPIFDSTGIHAQAAFSIATGDN